MHNDIAELAAAVKNKVRTLRLHHVMAALVAATHVLPRAKGVDPRAKPGDDVEGVTAGPRSGGEGNP